MKIWRFSDPNDYRYARAGRHGGTWQEGEPFHRTRVLTIEWLPDSALIGDFTWPGLDTDIVVTDRVGKALADACISGFVLATIEMVENSGPRKNRASTKPRVKLPYAGPRLWDLWVTSWAQLDVKRSTVKLVGKRADGSGQYDVEGIERRETSWDQERMEPVRRQHPRVEDHGLFVQTDTAIFRLVEFPGWVFCTDQVKQVIENHEFTNVSFLEMGEVLSSAV